MIYNPTGKVLQRQQLQPRARVHPPEELPEELRMVLTLMLQEKAEKTKKADAGAAVARACGVDNK